MEHKWSGWPGAHCLVCGVGDAMEHALADNWYDPSTDTWDTEEHKAEVHKAMHNCPGEGSGQVDINDNKANMYGCFPCPQCGSEFRWPIQPTHPNTPNTIICDDCGFEEPIVNKD